MEGSFHISYRDKTVGTVHMTRQGLYTLLCCRCTLPDRRIYKLQAETSSGVVSLGTLCPVDGMFGLDTRVPGSRLGQGSIRFSLLCKDALPNKIPITPEQPFPYISRLMQCRLTHEDGNVFLLLPEEKIG